MPAWVAPAVAAAGSLIGMGIAKGKDKRQLEQQRKLQDLSIEGNKEMMEEQYKMWERTGYGAQKRQMKEAGINPALMYGMGGGGGQSMGSPGSVATGMAPAGSGNETETMAGMGIQAVAQLGLMEAQKKNIEADTKVKEEQAGNIDQDTFKKVGDTSLVYAQAEKITQEIAVLKGTIEAQIDKIKGEAESAWTKGKVDSNTVNEQIEGKVQEMLQQGMKNANIEADTAKKIADVAIGWKELDLEERRTKVQELVGGEQKDQDQMINLINTIVGIVGKFIPGGRFLMKK